MRTIGKEHLSTSKVRKAPAFLIIKIACFYYLLFFILTQLTAPTAASFNDTHKITGLMKAGTWTSSLSFVKNGSGAMGKCEGIYAKLQNSQDSAAVKEPVQYEVYWLPEGNQEKRTVVHSGKIQVPAPGDTVTITYHPTKNGAYIFRSNKTPGHSETEAIWSEDVIVSCKKAEHDNSKSHQRAEDTTTKAPPQSSHPQQVTEQQNSDKEQKHQTKKKTIEKSSPENNHSISEPSPSETNEEPTKNPSETHIPSNETN
ncbi:amyloid fiber anchoring/assembly protein TapA [Metabacillus arenae]|uniref:Amyloid fiber anchoring/assembly protein TapA n=1 Tax=Metabacillus arenae TaxID=2771434 RepID=A0A926NKB3_9BACI|nr:amyloid fiber anchoring/assembly protein TapA [Metabacillus arenae]MBD1382335.1 amyloid fiber anchoring/assembly protein TapA [Metabacillus arenae]